MAIIGIFTKTSDGFTGTIKSLTLNVKTSIRPSAKDNDKAPDFRLFAGTVEFGAAWAKTSAAGSDYMSCKLDDPSFPAPIYASLVAADDGESYTLIWSR
ncbi:MAG: DUF736 domain-containing protein [Sphingopyxis sp.]|nr:DUF736 domain-containing protein [Sphingopyxis sp.]OHC42932.1 MAG: hypothetical protein A2092_19950 [Rhodobacteraceae bacterium GWE1_64_9]OHC90548.1 MAG: hypothetical protein A2095_12720 [Sphingomonadales bacterium GWF1_63_6]